MQLKPVIKRPYKHLFINILITLCILPYNGFVEVQYIHLFIGDI